MFLLLLSWVGSGTHRFIAARIVMSMAATGVVITIVTGSIVFLGSVGTAASLRSRRYCKSRIGRLAASDVALAADHLSRYVRSGLSCVPPEEVRP
jgi:hypothetical protein